MFEELFEVDGDRHSDVFSEMGNLSLLSATGLEELNRSLKSFVGDGLVLVLVIVSWDDSELNLNWALVSICMISMGFCDSSVGAGFGGGVRVFAMSFSKAVFEGDGDCCCSGEVVIRLGWS